MAQTKQRIAFLDWLRGFACILMFQTHGYDAWLAESARRTHLFGLSQLGGTLPAPLFLFSSGISLARVVGRVLLAREEEHEDVGPFFLSARLREMVKAGRIESQGDIFRIRYSEVRLPARQESTARRP